MDRTGVYIDGNGRLREFAVSQEDTIMTIEGVMVMDDKLYFFEYK